MLCPVYVYGTIQHAVMMHIIDCVGCYVGDDIFSSFKARDITAYVGSMNSTVP